MTEPKQDIPQSVILEGIHNSAQASINAETHLGELFLQLAGKSQGGNGRILVPGATTQPRGPSDRAILGALVQAQRLSMQSIRFCLLAIGTILDHQPEIDYHCNCGDSGRICEGCQAVWHQNWQSCPNCGSEEYLEPISSKQDRPYEIHEKGCPVRVAIGGALVDCTCGAHRQEDQVSGKVGDEGGQP